MFQNIAFIDGQNLHLGAKEGGWAVDHKKLRVYLQDKYLVTEAYYFLGSILSSEQSLYDNLKEAGYILSFREHSSAVKGHKKGNVDSDIIFSIMKKIIDGELSGQIYIISGDGDYKSLDTEFFDYLDEESVKTKIEYLYK